MLRLILGGALALHVGLGVGALGAHEITAKGLQIDHPWIRVTPKGAAATAGYLTIINTGPRADHLIGASLDGAARGEIHETTVEGGIARMRPRPDGVEIGPGETLTLEPNGLHIMFTDLRKSYDADTYIDGTLVFRSAGTVQAEFFVEAGSGKPHAAPGGGAKPSDAHDH